jgi:quercetin dioxygenase-like cupin family protein
MLRIKLFGQVIPKVESHPNRGAKPKMLYPRIPAGDVVSVSKQVLAGHEVEYAYFRKVGDTIPWHTHDDGHYSVLLTGTVKVTFGDEHVQYLNVPFSFVYFNKGERHKIEGMEDNTVTLQFHDQHPREWFDDHYSVAKRDHGK